MGIIPLWLFRRRKKRSPCAIVVGDGKFKLYIASDANQRSDLERLFGNRLEPDPKGAGRLSSAVIHRAGINRAGDSACGRDSIEQSIVSLASAFPAI